MKKSNNGFKPWHEVMNDVKSLKDKEKFYLNLGEESAAEIIRDGENYNLYEIPQYGGESRFVKTFSSIEAVLVIVYGWT